jgi:hypothetical protein
LSGLGCSPDIFEEGTRVLAGMEQNEDAVFKIQGSDFEPGRRVLAEMEGRTFGVWELIAGRALTRAERRFLKRVISAEMKKLAF